jgi:predicted anti-sigma-YlaC factor YlaD
MNHDKIRMSLSAHRDGELDKKLTDRIMHHLRSCESCRDELRELDQIDSLIKALPEISVSENFTSEIVAKAHAAQVARHWALSLPQRILDRFLRLADLLFELLPGHTIQRTGSLDEFGDFPPLSLSYAYFQLIGQ